MQLLSFEQNSTVNVSLNTSLEFTFTEPVDASTCTTASIQVREGPSFGRTVPGQIRIEGARVFFDPVIPTICDRSDGGLQADTSYRVTLVGFPEEFAIKNTRGQALRATENFAFSTRVESDPRLFADQIPGVPPQVESIEPASGSAAVSVLPGNEITLTISENLEPCSVFDADFHLQMVETGEPTRFLDAPNGNKSGFDPVADQTASHATWGGGGTTVSPTRTVPIDVILDQTGAATTLRIVPRFGRFPENALLVLSITSGIRDFGGDFLPTLTASFTTENLAVSDDQYVVENEGETPYLEQASTAEINTPRSPSKAQGFLVLAGDGDNGTSLTTPSAPETTPDCNTLPDVNDGILDAFAPTTDVVLDTGVTPNTCPNMVDGSTAVVWEFSRFTIPSGVTVTIIGVNPAIFLVNGPVTIEAGGTLLLKGGDGLNGRTATSTSGTWPVGVTGGLGVCGGGDGGDSQDPLESKGGVGGTWPMPIPFTADLGSYGEDGSDGFGSPDYPAKGGLGSGEGNAASWHGAAAAPNGPFGATSCGAGGGGGGHATNGGTGDAAVEATGNGALSAPARGNGGAPYDGSDDTMRQPSAGSGGGAGGYQAFPSYTSTRRYAGTQATGGSGGAGGGFVDITSVFDITINGTIDASGGRGGNGNNSLFCDTGSSGGGGGGSGGGIRLLTSASIDVSGGTLTAAGGIGGAGGTGPTCGRGTPGPRNNGGSGSDGRIVLEDADSVITGQASAVITPAEGSPGFYRGTFDTTRFVGGGRRSTALSDRFLVGSFDPTFRDPTTIDFIAGIPTDTADTGVAQIILEARGFQMEPDGTPEATSSTGWRTVGYFVDSLNPESPRFVLGQVPIDDRPADNTQPWGITNLDTCEYIQLRLTFVLRAGVASDALGPFLDRWVIRYSHDQ